VALTFKSLADAIRMTKNLSIDEIAHHEAGHAVAAIKFRKSFRYVTIDPNDYSRGRVMFKTSINPRLYGTSSPSH